MILRIIRQTKPIPVYWLIVGFFTALVSPPLSIIASVQIADRNTAHIIEVQNQQAATLRRESVARACDLIRSQVEVWEETPPTSPAGRNAQEKWLREYRLSECQPPK